MKKILIVVLVTGFAINASAQRYSHGGGGFYGRPRVMVSTGFYSPFYPYYGLFGYPFYPYPAYGYMQRPTRLDMQIADIKNDYRDKIASARQDKSLSRKQRKRTIQQLKNERDQAIIDAKRNYYKY